jgi:hypothetical protein
MKTRNTILATAVIAASIIFLILTTNDSAAAWSLEGKRTTRLVTGVAGNVMAESDFIDSLTARTAVAGVYDLSFRVFRNGVFEPVSSLPVLSAEMILMAQVADTSGNPAQNGTVTFEYCSYKGIPPGDIDNPDEAPKEACDARTATWDRLGRANIGSCLGHQLPGTACVFFGIVRIPRDVGFRFKYAGPRRGGVDSGMSDELDFTWTAAL